MLDDHGNLRAMTVHGENGVYRSGTRERRIQRRKQIGVGLAGLTVFGAAGLFVVQAIDLAESTTALELPATARTSSPSLSPSVSPSASEVRAKVPVPGKVTRSGARQERSPTPAPSLLPSSPAVAAADLVNRHDVNTAAGTIRVTSAGFDLTGEPELALVGDEGWTVGRARCTKTVRTAPGDRPRVVPSTLVCWRVSPQRSVVTLAVAGRGRLSSGESVAALEREWDRLG